MAPPSGARPGDARGPSSSNSSQQDLLVSVQVSGKARPPAAAAPAPGGAGGLRQKLRMITSCLSRRGPALAKAGTPLPSPPVEPDRALMGRRSQQGAPSALPSVPPPPCTADRVSPDSPLCLMVVGADSSTTPAHRSATSSSLTAVPAAVHAAAAGRASPLPGSMAASACGSMATLPSIFVASGAISSALSIHDSTASSADFRLMMSSGCVVTTCHHLPAPLSSPPPQPAAAAPLPQLVRPGSAVMVLPIGGPGTALDGPSPPPQGHHHGNRSVPLPSPVAPPPRSPEPSHNHNHQGVFESHSMPHPVRFAGLAGAGSKARLLYEELGQARQVASSTSQSPCNLALASHDSGPCALVASTTAAAGTSADAQGRHGRPIPRVAAGAAKELPAAASGGVRAAMGSPAPPKAAPDLASRSAEGAWAAEQRRSSGGWQPQPPTVRAGAPARVLHLSPFLPAGMARPLWAADDFRIIKRLHKGYASSVFKAICVRSQQVVALKVYYMATISEHIKHQIYREIEIHGSLHHPNIVELLVAFQDDKYVVMVQEYCSRGDLFDFVRGVGGRMAEPDVRDLVVAPLLDVLHYLHGHAIVHRDIKPENLLIATNGDLKLGDFGVAIDLSKERAVTQTGTQDYMAPEVKSCPLKVHPSDNKQNPNIGYTTAADVWSLGVLAYELMVGFPPFAASKQAAAAAASQQQQGGNARAKPTPVKPTFPRCISDAAKAAVTAALSPFSGDRPTASELLASPWMEEDCEAPLPHTADQD